MSVFDGSLPTSLPSIEVRLHASHRPEKNEDMSIVPPSARIDMNRKVRRKIDLVAAALRSSIIFVAGGIKPDYQGDGYDVHGHSLRAAAD